MEIVSTVDKEQLVYDIFRELNGFIYHGITTHELCYILKDKFRVAYKYCCDIIEELKIKLDMYCPDREHLYYVDQVVPNGKKVS
ncbi:hypothetical protein [Methanosalsum natronophilum]|uniref:hypothetical protein n=1 Tax=Methanosalsum natronophilum TaxID=768733 RepID=UPI00216887AE|nr:hypothetical protein [Methanosalsum natronophilum]MCS3923879.1 transposase [Methanosalsum natronophilum]